MINVILPHQQRRKLRKAHDQFTRKVHQDIVKALEVSTIVGQATAVERLMQQDVDFTGFTRKSIQRSVDRVHLYGLVESKNMKYGASVEYGFPAGYLRKPPPYGKGSALYNWVTKKMRVSAKHRWIVSKTIAENMQKYGRAEKPFMRPSQKAARERFSREMTRRLRR